MPLTIDDLIDAVAMPQPHDAFAPGRGYLSKGHVPKTSGSVERRNGIDAVAAARARFLARKKQQAAGQ